MKRNKFKLYLIIFLINTISIKGYAQSDWNTAGNALLGGEVMGSTSNFPLDFYTNGIHRMSLASSGNLGISDVWPFTPLSLIHLNRGLNVAVSARFTNINSTNGALFGIDANGNARISQQDPLAINFLTNGAQRVSIRGANNSPYIVNGLSNVGYVGIGTTTPGSPLTIQGDDSPSGQIIPGSNWSNGIMIRNNGTLIFEGDRANIPANRDFFMAHPSINSPVGDYFEGLVPGIDNTGVQYVYRLYGRTQPNNPIQGTHRFLTTVLADVRVGVNTLFPSMRTEIVEPVEPQLRLTNIQDPVTPGNSVRTDFQTTAAGDMFINPSNAGTNRRVGINTAAPQNTLEIQSPGPLSNGPNGSGLRFSNMNNGVAPLTNPDPQNGVLSVNENGDVIFVVDEGGGGAGTGDVTACTIGGGVNVNFITKWSTTSNEICSTSIFEEPTGANNVGIGTITPANRLEVAGDINVSLVTNCIRAQGFKILGLAPANSSTTLVGRDAGGVDNNTTANAPDGPDNTLVGYQAGFAFPPAGNGVQLSYNTCIGAHAGQALGTTATTGIADANTFVGAYCSQTRSTGLGNTAVGIHSGSSFGNGTGDYNSSLGFQALTHGTSGNNNSALGYWALRYTETGSNNAAIGFNAGTTNITGSNNSFLGANADVLSDNLNFATAIGADAMVNASHAIAIGTIYDQVVLRGSTPQGTFGLTLNGDSYQSSGNADWNIPLDLNLERNISDFTDGLNVIRNVHPINFNYKSNNIQSDTSENKIGVSGQEMALVAPYTMDTIMAQLDSSSAVLTPVLTFNRNGLFYALLNAVKELDSTDQTRVVQLNQLQTQVNDFTTLLSQLQAQLDSCCSHGHGHGHGHERNINPNEEEGVRNTDVRLSNTKAIILNQNVPNPFAEQTTISYFIPEEVNKAQIFFYDNNGIVLKVVDINEKGSGELNVFAADLSSGIYSYTLIADGKVIETKKMVRQ